MINPVKRERPSCREAVPVAAVPRQLLLGAAPTPSHTGAGVKPWPDRGYIRSAWPNSSILEQERLCHQSPAPGMKLSYVYNFPFLLSCLGSFTHSIAAASKEGLCGFFFFFPSLEHLTKSHLQIFQMFHSRDTWALFTFEISHLINRIHYPLLLSCHSPNKRNDCRSIQWLSW